MSTLKGRGGEVPAPDGSNASQRLADAIASAPWPDPEPLTLEEAAPDFPTGILPAWAEKHAEAVALSVQAPVSSVKVAALGYALIAARAKFDVLTEDNRQPGVLWWFISQRTGERKSPVMRQMDPPIWEAVEAYNEAYSHEFAESRVEAKALAAALADRESAYKKALSHKNKIEGTEEASVGDTWQKACGDVDTARANWEDAEEAASRFTPIIERIAFIHDATPQAFSRLLEAHEFVAFADAEGTQFRNLAGRYADGEAQLESTLKSYDRDANRIERVSSGATDVGSGASMFLVNAQPVVLRDLAKDDQMLEQGFLGRVQIIDPEPLVGTRNPFEVVTIPQAVRDTYNSSVRMISESADQIDGVHDSWMPPEAVEIMKHLVWEWEQRIAPGGDLVDMVDWVNKSSGTFMRACGLLAVMRTRNVSGAQITEEDAIGAKRLLEWLLVHRRRARAIMVGRRNEETIIERVVARLKDLNQERVFARDLYKPMNMKKADMEPVLDELEQKHYLKYFTSDQRRGLGYYAVNPKLLSDEGEVVA